MGKFTNAGLELLAAYIADHTKTFDVKWMGLGDFNGGAAPVYGGTEAKMTHNWWHGEIKRRYIEPANNTTVHFEALFEADAASHGKTIQEVALFVADPDNPDSFEDAVLFWISAHPESHIPEAGDTVVSEVITIPIQFNDDTVGAVNLTIDLSDAALATLRDLIEMTAGSVSYTAYEAVKSAEMDGLIRAKIMELHHA